MRKNSVSQLLLIKTYSFTVCMLSVLIASILVSVPSLCIIEAAQASSSDHKQKCDVLLLVNTNSTDIKVKTVNVCFRDQQSTVHLASEKVSSEAGQATIIHSLIKNVPNKATEMSAAFYDEKGKIVGVTQQDIPCLNFSSKEANTVYCDLVPSEQISARVETSANLIHLNEKTTLVVEAINNKDGQIINLTGLIPVSFDEPTLNLLPSGTLQAIAYSQANGTIVKAELPLVNRTINLESDPIFVSDQKLQELKFIVTKCHTDKLSQTDIYLVNFNIKPVFTATKGKGQVPNLKISAKDIAFLNTDFSKDQITIAEAAAEGDDFVLRIQTIKKAAEQSKIAIQIEAALDLNSISGQPSQLCQTGLVNVID